MAAALLRGGRLLHDDRWGSILGVVQDQDHDDQEACADELRAITIAWCNYKSG